MMRQRLHSASTTFCFPMFKHTDTVVPTSSTKRKMSKSSPTEGKGFSNLEFYWVYFKRKDSDNIIP